MLQTPWGCAWLIALSLLQPGKSRHLETSAATYELDARADERSAKGKAKLDELAASANESPCYQHALRRLTNGCAALDADTQARLAVAFANCHLQLSGLDTYECSPAASIEECTKPMVTRSPNSLAYNVYTHFYTHAESMCYFLQGAAFQARTEHLVTALHDGARLVAAQLDEQKVATATIISKQIAAAESASMLLSAQARARDEVQLLSTTTADSLSAARLAIDEAGGASRAALEGLKRDTEEINLKSRSLLGGLDRLIGLQTALLGEFMDVRSVVFFVCAIVLTLALSSSRRTSAARLPALVLLTANVLLEKLLSSLLLHQGGAIAGAAPVVEAELVMLWVWRMRKLVFTLVCLTMAFSAITYRDLGQQAVLLLEELKLVHRNDSEELLDKIKRLEDSTAALRSQRDTAAALLRSTMKRIHRRASSSPLSPRLSRSPHRRRSPLSPQAARGGRLHSPNAVASPPRVGASADALDDLGLRPPPVVTRDSEQMGAWARGSGSPTGSMWSLASGDDGTPKRRSVRLATKQSGPVRNA